MRVFNLPVTTPLLAFSCNYSIIIGFIDTLRRGLTSIDTLYCFNTVEVIFLALFLV
jgi:hypothetical protein